ncbi:MAG: NUDIX hydrolase [Jiangellaceae bacterium]
MTSWADAHAVLTSWAAPDPIQAQLRNDFVEYLERHPDGLDRGCAPAHITASALVVSPTRGQVLLLLHAKAGLWLQAGGHVEPDDATLAVAALREATEESGISGLELASAGTPVRLDRHRAPCRPGVVEHHLDVQYLAWAPTDAVAVRSAESRDIGWFDYGALPEPTDDALRALVNVAATML